MLPERKIAGKPKNRTAQEAERLGITDQSQEMVIELFLVQASIVDNLIDESLDTSLNLRVVLFFHADADSIGKIRIGVNRKRSLPET
jgi:hypothetical protein